VNYGQLTTLCYTAARFRNPLGETGSPAFIVPRQRDSWESVRRRRPSLVAGPASTRQKPPSLARRQPSVVDRLNAHYDESQSSPESLTPWQTSATRLRFSFLRAVIACISPIILPLCIRWIVFVSSAKPFVWSSFRVGRELRRAQRTQTRMHRLMRPVHAAPESKLQVERFKSLALLFAETRPSAKTWKGFSYRRRRLL
jgi:hypothetical protein